MATKSPAHRCADCSRNDDGTCTACKLPISLEVVRNCVLCGWRPAQRVSAGAQRGTDDGVEFPLIDTRHSRYE